MANKNTRSNTVPANKDADTTTDVGNITDNITVNEGVTEASADYEPNQPTITGFTAEDNGTIAPKEVAASKTIDRDQASNIRTAIDLILGYQTGSTYRSDFESGVETLRSFGLSYNEAQADGDANKVRDEVIANEQGQVAEASSDDK